MKIYWLSQIITALILMILVQLSVSMTDSNGIAHQHPSLKRRQQSQSTTARSESKQTISSSVIVGPSNTRITTKYIIKDLNLNSITTLQDGIPIQGSVESQKYVYYKFNYYYPRNVTQLTNGIRSGTTTTMATIGKGEHANVMMNEDQHQHQSSLLSSSSSSSSASLSSIQTTDNTILHSLLSPYDPTDPSKHSIQFDLQMLSGDADLLIICILY